MKAHVSISNSIPNFQFGFRTNYFIRQQICRIAQFITHNFNLNKHTNMVLFDVVKAFDTTWRAGIMCKIIDYKFLPYLIRLIND